MHIHNVNLLFHHIPKELSWLEIWWFKMISVNSCFWKKLRWDDMYIMVPHPVGSGRQWMGTLATKGRTWLASVFSEIHWVAVVWLADYIFVSTGGWTDTPNKVVFVTLTFLANVYTKKCDKVEGTCSYRTLAGQSQQTLLLQDETCTDKSAGAHGQRETDIEVLTIHFHL